MDTPVLYIIAGPNGIGKTTSAFDIIPQNIPIISSDEIAKQVRAAELVKTNTQEYSNREAQLLCNSIWTKEQPLLLKLIYLMKKHGSF
jgi:predicted ABC-type ATPase